MKLRTEAALLLLSSGVHTCMIDVARIVAGLPHDLSKTGQETLAADAGCCARTVRRALEALKALGLVMWQRRIVRAGWQVAQTSNA